MCLLGVQGWAAVNLPCTEVDKIHLLFAKNETKNPKGPEKDASISSLKSISSGPKGKRDRSRCHRCAPVPQREGSNLQSTGWKCNRGNKTSQNITRAACGSPVGRMAGLAVLWALKVSSQNRATELCLPTSTLGNL